MTPDFELIKKKAAVFLLTHEQTAKHELIDKTAAYFMREIDGQEVSGQEWEQLRLDLARALARAVDMDLALARARALARTRARTMDLDMDLDLAAYLLAELGDYVPYIPDVNSRIKNDVEKNGCHLEMSSWHDEECSTTHCAAGFMEIYAGEKGKEMAKHFGHWLVGALIDLKSTGKIRDFYASNENAWQYICDGAKQESA